MKVCPKCHKDNEEKNTFCFDCGSPLEKKCPSCGCLLTPTTKFCPECGTPIVAEASREMESNVTLLSVDIQGSTEWISDKDTEEAYEWIDQALEVMSETVTNYYGHILALTGDGIAAFFDRDNHPLQACFTAAAMQQKLLSLKLPFHVRIGIHSAHIDKDTPSLIIQSEAFKTAQALEGKAPEDGIQISYAVLDPYEELLKVGKQVNVQVSDKPLPVASYTLRELDPSVETLIGKTETKEDEHLEGFESLSDIDETLGEHKFLTACFIKISSLKEVLDDEERNKIDTMVKESISEFGGTFIKQVGETTLACYGAPVAYEDHILRACLSSFFLLQRVIDYQMPLDIRIGIHCGDAVVNTIGGKGYRQYDLIGASVNLAARLMQTASEDQIQISSETLKNVEPYIQTLPLGIKKVKGIAKPIQTFALTGINRSTIRKRLDAMFYGDTPFIGRQKEMELFTSMMKDLSANKGSLLAVKAEPGVGKTRLFYEFSQQALKEEMIIFSVSSSAYEQTESFSTLRVLIKNLFGISRHTLSPMQLNNISLRLREVRFSEKSAKTAILKVLRAKVEDSYWDSLSPVIQENILFQSVVELVQSFCQISPVILIFEDLHWCDQDSLHFISFFASSLHESKVIFLLDYRPTFTPPDEIKQAGREHLLEPLDEKMSQQLIDITLPGSDDIAPLKEKILEITQGNPYFIEEYVKTLINSHAVIQRDHEYILAKEPNLQALPHTIESLIHSEVDKLPKTEKTLLQQASILGRVFDVSHLHYISNETEEEFNRALTALAEKGFVYATEMIGYREYTFKHAYLCTTVYHGMLKKTRLSYHQKLVSEIEKNKADELPKYYLFLANHSHTGELWEKALHYYSLASNPEVSIESPATQKIQIGDLAMDCYQHLTEQQKKESFNDFGKIMTLQIQAYYLSNQVVEASQLAEQTLKESIEQGNTYYEVVISILIVPPLSMTGHNIKALEITQHVDSLLQTISQTITEQDQKEIQREIDMLYQHCYYCLGKFHEFDEFGHKYLNEATDFRKALFETIGVTGSPCNAVAFIFFAVSYTVRAKTDVFHHMIEKVLEFEDEDIPPSEATVHIKLAITLYYFFIGDYSQCIRYAMFVHDLCSQLKFMIHALTASVYQSISLFYIGENESALQLTEQMLPFLKQTNYAFFSTGHYYWGEVLARNGKFQEAQELLENITTIAEGDNEKTILAGCYRQQALLYNLMADDNKDDEKILQLLEKSQQLVDEIGCNFETPFIQHTYEEFYQRKGDKQKAEEHHNKALKYFKDYGMTGWYDHFK